MERAAAAPVAGFFCTGPLRPGPLRLDADAAHHVRVRRIAVGDRLRLTDGRGRSATARLVAAGRHDAEVEVEIVAEQPPPPAIHLLPPVADRERMLWLAEKAVELGLRGWLPVTWRRSRSVSPRGEGESFRGKVRARMVAALEQSGGAWLPELADERPLDARLAALPDGHRLLLDGDGATLAAAVPLDGPVVVAVGPEGGLEETERERLLASGFRPVSLGPRVLRFETAGVAALAALGVLRAGIVPGVTTAAGPPARAS